MGNELEWFEELVRNSQAPQISHLNGSIELHSFDERNIHPEITTVAKKLFDDGHFAQATFEAFKQLDKIVGGISGTNESGYKLMMNAFSDKGDHIRLTNLTTTSETDEQKGYQFIFSGSVLAIRNPRGHEVNLPDTIDMCLDHLSIASALLRRLEQRIGP